MHFDTRSALPPHRAAFWNSTVESVLNLDSETTSLDDVPLETSLEQCDVGELSILSVKGSRQQLALSGWSASNALGLLIPRTTGGSVESQGRTEELKTGRGYVLGFKTPLRIRTNDCFEHTMLFARAGFSDLSRAFLERSGTCSLSLDGGVAAILAEAMLALVPNAPRMTAPGAAMVAKAMLELLDAALTEALEVNRTFAPRLDAYHRQRIRRHALANLGDPDLSVQSIALAVNLSIRRVHQLFASGDMTLMRWIWSERLARCHSRLVDPKGREQPIGLVAYEWGFSDPAHFSRAFRQRYGVSPSQHARDAAANPAGVRLA
jgi:AraC-like DNA-binding protein